VLFERNPRFTDYEFQFAKFEKTLFMEGQIVKVAIIEFNDINKTQLIFELVYRIREKYKNCLIIWIPAINIENL
jgi:hypothetical protein